MKQFIFYVVVVANLCLMSCDNSEDILVPSNIGADVLNSDISAETKSSEMVIDTLSFIYEGEKYSSICEVWGDSLVILDENVRVVTERLAQLPELATFVNSDGSIECFDNSDLLEQRLSMRPVPYLSDFLTDLLWGIKVTIFDDENYKDRSFEFTEPFEIAQLKDSPYQFNDKMSSFKFEGTWGPNGRVDKTNDYLLTFWEDDNFQNHSVWYRVTNYPPKCGDVRISSMKNIPLYPGSSKNWNDKVTSVRLTNTVRYH